MQNLLGVLVSLLYVGLILGLSALLAAKAGWGGEATRKLAHIALGGWWLLAMVFFTAPLWAAVPPTLFVAVNYRAWRGGGLPFLQRGGQSTHKKQDTQEEPESPGTVYYAVSLLLLALFCFGPAQPFMGALGVFCMAFGDGLAALAGQKLSRRTYMVAGGTKSLAGSLTMLVVSFGACLTILLVFAPAYAVVNAAVLATFATVAEVFSPHGLDNITVPLGVTALYYTLQNPASPYSPALLGCLLSLVVVLLAFYKGWLTQPAGLAAVLVGAALYWLGGWALWCLLIWFFASANLATRLLAARHNGGKKEKQHSPRKLRQVLANSLPALLCATAYRGGNGWFLVLSAAALAACTADTWASEIGIYSRGNPVNILTLKPMAKGLSGGVSPLGLAASTAGAFCTAVLAMLLFHTMDPTLPTGPAAFLLVGACGTAGSLVDSVLGALLQAKYRCAGVDGLVEAPQGTVCTLVSGVRWMTNDMVNLLSGSLVVVLALPVAVL